VAGQSMLHRGIGGGNGAEPEVMLFTGGISGCTYSIAHITVILGSAVSRRYPFSAIENVTLSMCPNNNIECLALLDPIKRNWFCIS
jgi:hypothetical protein